LLARSPSVRGTYSRGEGVAAKAAKPAKIEPLGERASNDGWAAEDWRARFAERIAVAELHRGLPHAAAELWAFEAVVIEWLNANPSPSPRRTMQMVRQIRNGERRGPAVRH